MLEFGIFDHLERQHEIGLEREFDERLRLISRADELGFYGYHLAEHHQSPLCMAPSQNVFLAAAARQTHRIKLGTLVHLLPLYHPLRFIEEVCMLDNLSQGRLQIGLGRGITAIEHTYWGLSPSDAQRRYAETLAIIVQGFASDTLTYHGEFYDFDRIPLELSPMQKPHPPFWYASGSPEYAAQEGLHFVSRGGAGLPRVMARYSEIFDQNRHRADRLNPQVQEPWQGSSRHIFVADTDAEAERVARQAWSVYQDNFAKRGMDGPGPETRPDGTQVPVPAGGPGTTAGRDFDHALRFEAALVGSPETIRAYVQRYAEESGANYFMAAFQWGSLTHEQALHSLELFATEVMPGLETTSSGAARQV
ncbi:MAG: LLM class flavin-dependent oxidoreductase [Chloroflexi bacterium]|nr:LLM class flavin-dependent oxidoreductase [Chloroflexota bacterium]